MEKGSLEFIMRVLKTVEFDNCDDIFWRTDGEYAPITFLAMCNDMFWWGTADCEEITPENIDVFEQAFADCRAAAGRAGTFYGTSMFVARVRKMRPQGAAYPPMVAGEEAQRRALWALFDACGPAREPDMGNPKRAPGEAVSTP